MKKAFPLLSLNLLLNLNFLPSLSAQENISIATGISVLHNFSPAQTFNAVGHTIQAVVHFTPKQSVYTWAEYYTEGKFNNNFTATAKLPLASPQQLALLATGRLTYRQFSLGWRHYFKGGYAEEQNLNFYGLAGFGFLFAKVRNEFSTAIDTTQYNIATTAGQGTVHRLTFDLGLGAEKPFGGQIYAFADLRSWLPASSNPSPYLHSQRNVPLAFMLSAGIRVLLATAY